MKFRNRNNDEVVDTTDNAELKDRLDALDNWVPLDGEVDLGEEGMTLEEWEGVFSEAEDDDLLTLTRIANAEVASRGLSIDEAATAETPDTTGTLADQGNDSDESADSASVDATDAARELAASEDIDLSEVEGTGKDGRIGIDDVRKAVEAKG